MRADHRADEVRADVRHAEALLQQLLDIRHGVGAVGVADEQGLVLVRLDAQLLHLVDQRLERSLGAARLAHGNEPALAVGVHDGLDAQHRADEGRRGAHATAALEVVEIVHDEPVALGLEDAPHICRQRLDVGAVEQHSLSARGGERVDDNDLRVGVLAFQVLRRDAGGLVGGGQGRGEADAQDILPLLQNGGHGVLKLAHVDGGGGGHFARPDPPVKLLVADGRAIQGVGIVLPVHVHGQGQHLQLQVLCHLVRQVAAAVGHENIFAHGKNLLGRYSFRVFSTSNIPY